MRRASIAGALYSPSLSLSFVRSFLFFRSTFRAVFLRAPEPTTTMPDARARARYLCVLFFTKEYAAAFSRVTFLPPLSPLSFLSTSLLYSSPFYRLHARRVLSFFLLLK